MRRTLSLLLCLLLLPAASWAVRYEKSDSIRVEALLRDGAALPADSSLMLYYARQFLGLPYVGRTLESEDGREELVVNLRQMDCTTLVETVTALTLATRHGGRHWADFCNWLLAIRYFDGQMDGYASRCHYFSQWIASAERRGLVSEVKEGTGQRHYPFTQVQKLDLHYMSHHRSAYPVIGSDEAAAERVAQREQESSGQQVRYIPASLTGKGRRELSCIQDGDILALVTSRDGLDVSHLGIAVWGSDGRLHLLNASSISHRVVLDSVPLYRYLQKHPSSVGIRVIRVCR